MIHSNDRPVIENCYAFAHFSGSCFFDEHEKCKMENCPCDCHPNHDKYIPSFLTELRKFISERQNLREDAQ